MISLKQLDCLKRVKLYRINKITEKDGINSDINSRDINSRDINVVNTERHAINSVVYIYSKNRLIKTIRMKNNYIGGFI